MGMNGAHEYLYQHSYVGWPRMVSSSGTTWQGTISFLQGLLGPGTAVGDFPVLANLAPAADSGTTTDLLLGLVEQRRRCRLLKKCRHRLMQIVEDRTPLLRTGRDHGPNPFAPAPACFPTGALRNLAINHHEADGLFSQVVGGFHVGRRHKLKVFLPIFLKASGQIAAVRRG